MVIDEIEDVIGIEAQDAPLISAKDGIKYRRSVRADRYKDSGADREMHNAPLTGIDL